MKRGRKLNSGIAFVDGKPTRSYSKWLSMIARCYRKDHPAFRYYGARGITVCERWRESFRNFLNDMGDVLPGFWLDRIDNSRGYEPGNCRWVTPKESAANRQKRQPDPDSLRSKARAAGLSYHLVYFRLRSGWSLRQALATPKMRLH